MTFEEIQAEIRRQESPEYRERQKWRRLYHMYNLAVKNGRTREAAKWIGVSTNTLIKKFYEIRYG